jgi:hypothetical protein
MAILAFWFALSKYWGTCVDLPHPVFPLITTAGHFSASSTIYASYCAIGKDGDNY